MTSISDRSSRKRPSLKSLYHLKIKYRDEEDLLAKQPDPQKYNDEVIFPDKVRLNLYYLHHYSFLKDIQMIFATVLGHRIHYANQTI